MNEINNENKRSKSKERWQKGNSVLKDSDLENTVLSPLKQSISILNKFSKVSNIANLAGKFSTVKLKEIDGVSKGTGIVTKVGVDSKKKDTIETKFITKLMRKGKKEKAEIILVKALKKVEQELLKKEPVNASVKGVSLNNTTNKQSVEKNGNRASPKASEHLIKNTKSDIAAKSISKETDLSKILEKIIENAKPLIRLKKIRIAGATHQKPVALTKKQAETDAIKRIITNAKARSEKSATLKLAKEFEEIYLNTVSNKTLTEVRELHKLAEANKANITLK